MTGYGPTAAEVDAHVERCHAAALRRFERELDAEDALDSFAEQKADDYLRDRACRAENLGDVYCEVDDASALFEVLVYSNDLDAISEARRKLRKHAEEQAFRYQRRLCEQGYYDDQECWA